MGASSRGENYVLLTQQESIMKNVPHSECPGMAHDALSFDVHMPIAKVEI